MSTLDLTGFTLGVEEEYQLVDADSGELRNRARAVLSTDWTGDIKEEMVQNTLEVETSVCSTAQEVRRELARLRLEAAVVAEARGLRVVAAGTHPFSDPVDQAFTPRATYERIRRDYRHLALSQSIFGTHIHVAVPQGVDRVQVMNVARHYLPLLLALSASSPWFQGTDTGYASYRAILWRRWPRSGAPPRMADEAEFQWLLREMLRTGRLDGPGRLYWDLRPHHQYPTLEFRVADAIPRLEDAVLIAVLARLVVIGVAEGLLTPPEVPESMAYVLLVDNGWRASRDGLDAELARWRGTEAEPVEARAALEELAERLLPLARRLGDEAELARLPELLARGSAASRLRAWGRKHSAPPAELVRWLADETVLGLGLDRRREQRNAE